MGIEISILDIKMTENKSKSLGGGCINPYNADILLYEMSLHNKLIMFYILLP